MLPESTIDFKSIVQIESFGSNEPILLHKYATLHMDSARILGKFAGCKVSQLEQPGELDNICSSFCQKLNMTLYQATHRFPQISIVKSMLQSFLEAFEQETKNPGIHIQKIKYSHLFIILPRTSSTSYPKLSGRHIHFSQSSLTQTYR